MNELLAIDNHQLTTMADLCALFSEFYLQSTRYDY